MSNSSTSRTALITGLAGQDGRYLADQLLDAGYEVHGIELGNTSDEIEGGSWKNAQIPPTVTMHYGSLATADAFRELLHQVQPDECYHLAARSFAGAGLEHDCAVIEENVRTTCLVLSTVQEMSPRCRVFYAGTSEMFGRSDLPRQNEHTPLHPRNAYGVSKAAGFHMTRLYRQRGLFVACGILYNHESPRRGIQFVTRKVTRAVARISRGLEREVHLGALDARRDWGYAPEYVEAMRLMLRHDVPEDFVIATGVMHSVEDLCRVAFSHAGLDWREHVRVDPAFVRIGDHGVLCGDASKAARVLGWTPRSSFEDMIRMMVDADLAALDTAG